MSLFVPSSPNFSQLRDEDSLQSFLFAASTTHVAHLAEALNAITAVGNYAIMIIADNGITFYTDYNHILNVQLTIDASLFSSYHAKGGDLPEKSVHLGINAQLLSDACSAAAATTLPRAKTGTKATATLPDPVVCYLKYEGEGFPLVVGFEDRLMSEQIEFATFKLDFEYPYDDDAQESHNLVVDYSQLRFDVILKSDIFGNLLQDLQNLNTENLYMFVSNETKKGPSLVHFVSKGAIGYLKLLYPSEPTLLQKVEVFERDEIDPIPTEASVLSCLNFLPFIKILRAVKLSSKCKIMKDFHGVFSVQLLCRNLSTAASYPGTLITFNMLEKTVAPETGQSDLEIQDIFDDNDCQHVKEYDPAASTGSMVSATEPLSYASFRRADDSNKRHKTNEDLATVVGAVEVPLFL